MVVFDTMVAMVGMVVAFATAIVIAMVMVCAVRVVLAMVVVLLHSVCRAGRSFSNRIMCSMFAKTLHKQKCSPSIHGEEDSHLVLRNALFQEGTDGFGKFEML